MLDEIPTYEIEGPVGYVVSIPRALAYISLSGDWAELGVGEANSATLLCSLLPRTNHLYLFDSFEGLPEPWVDRPKGKFKAFPPWHLKRDNVHIRVGLFKDTLPVFVKEHPLPLSFVHIDCDLYRSAKDVLTILNPIIAPQTILLFDELYHYTGWEQHEYKALTEWLSDYDRQVQYLGKTSLFQVWMKVMK